MGFWYAVWFTLLFVCLCSDIGDLRRELIRIRKRLDKITLPPEDDGK